MAECGNFVERRRDSVKKRWIGLCVVVVLGLVIMPLSGWAEGNVAAGLKAGTLGIGPEIGFAFSKYVGARIGFNYLPFSYSGEKGDVEYDLDLNLQNVFAILDVHPFKNALRLSGGLFYNGNSLDAKGKPSSGTFTIGDHKYPAALVGNLKGDIDFNDFAPYCGLGIDTTFGKERDFGLSLELGVLYQGSPNVSLTSDGPLSNDRIFLNDLAKEEAKLKDDLENFKFYPVISVGITYRF